MAHDEDYSATQVFRQGDRVELHPAHDLWMRGAKYGEVTRVSEGSGSLVYVRIDVTNRVRWFHRESLRHVR